MSPRTGGRASGEDWPCGSLQPLREIKLDSGQGQRGRVKLPYPHHLQAFPRCHIQCWLTPGLLSKSESAWGSYCKGGRKTVPWELARERPLPFLTVGLPLAQRCFSVSEKIMPPGTFLTCPVRLQSSEQANRLRSALTVPRGQWFLEFSSPSVTL